MEEDTRPADEGGPGLAVVEKMSPAEEAERAEMIGEPAKLLRIATMTRSMLAEARTATLDEDGRARLSDVYRATLNQLRSVLTDDLTEEFEEYFQPLAPSDQVPTQAEIRLAQAQLVGWLEGLFSGIQAAIVSQQMAARAQLRQIRAGGDEPDHSAEEPHQSGGLYL